MSAFKDDPFEVLVVETETDELSPLVGRTVSRAEPFTGMAGASTARFHGFDLDDQPVLAGVAGLPGELIRARSTVALQRAQIGSTVVVVFDQGDLRKPIVLGVIRDRLAAVETAPPSRDTVSAQVDDDRLVLTAEREIVLRCGEASITLTRAGKVLIKGTYVLSRSSGYNKIKGAAVDIN